MQTIIRAALLGLIYAGCTPTMQEMTTDSQWRARVAGYHPASPITEELAVNEHTLKDQHHPRVALGTDRRWRVMWTSHHGGLDRRAIGGRTYRGPFSRSEELLQTPPVVHHHPKVVAFANHWVVAWQSTDDGDVHLGKLNTQSLGDTVLVVDGTPQAVISQCALAAAPDGTIAVVWYERSPPQSTWTYRAQTFSSTLVPLASPIILREGVTPSHGGPLAVAAAGDHGFVVTYSESAASGGGTIWIQQFNNGLLVGQPRVVVSDSVVESTRPRVASNRGGALAVTWRSFDPQHSTVWSEYTVFNAQHQVVLPPQPIDGVSADRPSIAAAGGHFAIIWEGSNGTDDDVFMRLYQLSDGEPVSPAQRLNQHVGGDQERPDVTLTPTDTDLLGVAVWESGDDQDGDGRGVFARSFWW